MDDIPGWASDYSLCSLALEAAAGHFRGEQARLQRTLQERTNWALKAGDDVKARDAEVLRLQDLVEESTNWALKAVDDVKIRDAEIGRLRQILEKLQGPAKENTQ